MRLAADANVLLPAVIGGRARDVLHPDVEALTTAPTFAEVQEYLAHLARKRNLPLDTVLLAAASLLVSVVDHSEYAARIPEATSSPALELEADGWTTATVRRRRAGTLFRWGANRDPWP